MTTLSCFKAYDIRGKLGEELNEEISYRIGRAYAQFLGAKHVVVGGDARATSEPLKLALAQGLMDSGCNVTDIGMVGTEEIYFATSNLKMDGGIVITASHNPIDYNGMKLVRENSKPISGDTGLNEIKAIAEKQNFTTPTQRGKYNKVSNEAAYIDHLLSYIDIKNITPLKIVTNAGNGAAGHVIDALEKQFIQAEVPIEFIKVHHHPDHTFPNGIPNPLLPDNRADTANAVLKHGADLGIAWDGDFDRCFLFDENGEFIEGYYIVGLLAEAFLQKSSNERIIYDPRVYWNTEDIINQYSGTPIMSKTGHAFIKERMRKEDAVYGGEMSAHHYFRDFFYCDSGMIPWLLVAELLCVKNIKLSALVANRIESFPSSGEINQKVDDVECVIQHIEALYGSHPGAKVDYTDGINICFSDWRFNLRKSNTEPLIRLNVESKGNKKKMEEMTVQLLEQINHPETQEMRGAIDTVDAGMAYGWVSYVGSDKPLSIHVMAENRIVGSGEANLFRQDLLDAGIGNGYHGYKIPVETLPLNDGRDVEYTLVNAETGQAIPNVSFSKHQLSQSFSAEIQREEHGHLIINIASNQPIYHKHIQLFNEEHRIGSIEINTEAKEFEVRFALPIKLMDGVARLYKVGIAGYTDVLTARSITVHPIKTPWQYVKESFNKPGFLSMSKQADKRYESLNYNLEALARGESKVTAVDLVTAHQVVVEGYVWRNKYPKFSLPKWDNPEVTIIVPAYNKFELSYHCIASIALAYNKTSYEVILADDCSTDETSYAEDIIGNLIVSRNEENLRFLRSCNRATDKANGQYIVFLNNDTEVTSYWLDELVNKMKADQSVGMTGSKLLNPDGSMQEAGGIVWENGQPWNVGRNLNPMTPEYNYVREVDYLTGAAMCIRTDLWLEVGKFSEELVPCYYEDTDLAFKVRAAGYKTVYIPHSEVVHFEGQSHGTDVNKGLKRYQIVNEKTFRQKWFKEYRNNGKASLSNLRFEKDRNIDQRVLVIDYTSPMPNKDAGSYAAIQEMKLIQSLGFKVTFVPANLAHFGKYTTELQKMGIEVLYAPFYHSVNHVLETRLDEFDAVYITRYNVAKDYIDYIRQNSEAKIIFNNADLHFLRELRAALLNGKDQTQIEIALQTRNEELDVCRKADAVLCYNSTEHAVITSHILEAEKLHITPWVLEDKPNGPVFEKREGIAFLGGFNHTPNVECVEYLVNDIMPLLEKERPDIKLYVYGSNMPKHIQDMETDSIKMVGFAETLDGVYHDHRVFVAPLLSGAGIKGKVLESMAYNLPTVLTEVAAEGTGLTHGISTLIAKSPQEWVEAIIKLYDDKQLWNQFAENSKTLVDAKYSAEHGHKIFKKIFASIGVYSSL